MATDESAITAIQELITALEKEAADAKRTLNRMLVRGGKPPRYSDAELNADSVSVGQILPDRFYNLGLAPAMKDYLKMRKASNLGPATIQDIYEAMVRGGFKFETENEDNRRRGMRQSLTKNTVMFHKLPNGNFGLVDWYGDLKIQDEPAPKKGKARKQKKIKKSDDRSNTPPPKVASVNLKPSAKATVASGKVTLLDAVRNAILSMNGDEFTKQDVLDQITEAHPELRAEDRKTSIFSMIAKMKDELNLVTAFHGKGKEPFKYKREVK